MQSFKFLILLYMISWSNLMAQNFIPKVLPEVKLGALFEDKADKADAYYGLFKYQDVPYTGAAITYYENKRIKSLRHFKDGYYHGYWTEWYPNGNLKFRGDRRRNKGHGLTRWWYENGQLKKQGTYDMDKQQGVVIRWYPNGQLQRIRYYQQDRPTGGWTTFDEEGKVVDQGDDQHLYYQSFWQKETKLEEASPVFTADGQTMVFTRYLEWQDKTPFIANKVGDAWQKQQLSVSDTLYNLSITPDGQRIIFGKKENVKEERVEQVYLSNKKRDQWQLPVAVKTLWDKDAGYFCSLPDGSLYYFCWKPKAGIYYSVPDADHIYSVPIWLSDAVSLEESTSFDVLMHPDKSKLILTQDYPKHKYKEYGEPGLYYYEKQGEKWQRIKRLPLGYAWGASITPERKFVFVRNGELQTIPLEELGIEW